MTHLKGSFAFLCMICGEYFERRMCVSYDDSCFVAVFCRHHVSVWGRISIAMDPGWVRPGDGLGKGRFLYMERVWDPPPPINGRRV